MWGTVVTMASTPLLEPTKPRSYVSVEVRKLAIESEGGGGGGGGVWG